VDLTSPLRLTIALAYFVSRGQNISNIGKLGKKGVNSSVNLS
jgi:hypothetical protein